MQIQITVILLSARFIHATNDYPGTDGTRRIRQVVNDALAVLFQCYYCRTVRIMSQIDVLCVIILEYTSLGSSHDVEPYVDEIFS